MALTPLRPSSTYPIPELRPLDVPSVNFIVIYVAERDQILCVVRSTILVVFDMMKLKKLFAACSVSIA